MKKCLTILMLVFITMNLFAQSESAPMDKDTVYWIHQKTYDRVIQSRMFIKGMSDDEMAGILLYKGGRNLTGSFVCELFGVITSSLYIMVSSKEESAGTVLAVVSGGFFIAGLVNLLSGYNKISKAGIVLQHKGIKVKASGTGISLNF